MINKALLGIILFVPFLFYSPGNRLAEVDLNLDKTQSHPVGFTLDSVNSKVDVSIDGAFFTSYRFDGKTPKPVLYPILTKSGKTVTRGFPYETRANERVDHPHHVGYWFNYGDVNGLDFWNNSFAIPASEKDKYGTIFHEKILSMDEGKGELVIQATWKAPAGEALLAETTRFLFKEAGTTPVY